MFPIGSSGLLLLNQSTNCSVADSTLSKLPWPSSPDDLGFVESVDRLGERIVVAVADAADRWFDARVFQALGVFYGEILASAIRVMDEAAAVNRPAIVQRLFERIEHEARLRRA